MSLPLLKSGCGDKRFIVSFGAYGWTKVLVLAAYEGEALDEAYDWASAHAPGLFCDDACDEAYQLAIAEGLSEEEAYERADMDTISAGNHGRRMNSWEVHVQEASRLDILRAQGRAA